MMTEGEDVMSRRSAAVWACIGLICGMTASPAGAQEADGYPARKIDFVVAFAAGGFADTLARWWGSGSTSAGSSRS